MPVYPCALRVADNPSENASRPHDAVLAAEIKLLPLLTYKSRISKRWIKPVSHLEDVNHESIGNGFLTEITQQIHSLRASGVISSHFASAAGSEMRTFRKSAGTLCTAPAETIFLAMDFILHCYVISWGVLGC